MEKGAQEEMNNRETLEKLENLDIRTPEGHIMKMILQNLILIEDRIYAIEKKMGIR